MAALSLRHVQSACKLFYSASAFPCWKNVYGSSYAFSVRFLYSEQYLGLDKYLDARRKTIDQFGNLKEKFCSRMKEYLQRNDQITVFTEDLKNMVYIMEDKEDEINICIQMMRRFNQQNKELRFGTFVFGPVAVRLFHHLDKPDIVMELLRDEELEGFFHQVSSFHVAMDLLFKHQRYQDVLSLFELLRSKNLYGSKFPKDCVLLATGACWMLNTKDSLDYATKIIHEARQNGAVVLRRAATYVSYLALKQNDPKTALEVLSIQSSMNYVTVRNLRLMALAEMDRLEDIFPALRAVVNYDTPTQSKRSQEICKETLERIQQSVTRTRNKEYERLYEQIVRALTDNNHLNNQSLEELLLSTINVQNIVFEGKDWSTYNTTRLPSSGMQRGRENARFPAKQFNRPRPGLRDMDE